MRTSESVEFEQSGWGGSVGGHDAKQERNPLSKIFIITGREARRRCSKPNNQRHRTRNILSESGHKWIKPSRSKPSTGRRDNSARISLYLIAQTLSNLWRSGTLSTSLTDSDGVTIQERPIRSAWMRSPSIWSSSKGKDWVRLELLWTKELWLKGFNIRKRNDKERRTAVQNIGTSPLGAADRSSHQEVFRNIQVLQGGEW